MRIKIKFVWYDLWIGAYWQKQDRKLYICIVPMLPIIITLRPILTIELGTIDDDFIKDQSRLLIKENGKIVHSFIVKNE